MLFDFLLENVFNIKRSNDFVEFIRSQPQIVSFKIIYLFIFH